VISRLQSSARQNQLTQAIQEYGRIVKIDSILRYLHNPDHRLRIHNQLNKANHFTPSGVRCSLSTSDDSATATPTTETSKANASPLLTNAIICWNTVYTQAAVEQLAQTTPVADDNIARLSPNSHEHINVHGRYDFHNLTHWHPANSDH
jgi:TnpA family transposase